MSFLIVRLRPAMKVALLSLILSVQSNLLAVAQSSSTDQQRRFTPQQLEELQEFARQFREDPSLYPPDEDSSVPRTPRSEPGIPARRASFRTPQQEAEPQEPAKIFDPFKNTDKSMENSNFDPSPDPPVDDKPNQKPQAQDSNQTTPAQNAEQAPAAEDLIQKPPAQDTNRSNPFSDDRAVDRLIELEPAAKPNSQPSTRPPTARPAKKPVDKILIEQWEQPPGPVEFEDDRTQSYQNPGITESQTRRPKSEVAPLPYQTEQPQSGNLANQQNPADVNSPAFEPRQVSPAQDPSYVHDPAYSIPESNQHPQIHGQQGTIQQYDGASGYAQPGYAQPSYVQPGYNQPGYDLSAYAQPGYDQQDLLHPSYECQTCDQNCNELSGCSQPGQRSYFANRRDQRGVAGVEPCYDCDSCGDNGCDFDCETPQFYLAGYGIAASLRNLDSGDDTLLANNGGGFGLALGQRQGRNLRTELEYAWRSNAISGYEENNVAFGLTGKIKSQAGMANAYWEFVNSPTRCLKPYVGAGIGFSRFDVELRDGFRSLTPDRSKDSSFAYQFMGGVNYQPTSYMDLFIEYRLFRTDSFQLATAGGFAAGRYNYEANNLVAGIRWKF